MAKYASTLINIAKSWLGCNEKDGSHKKIIDVYNAHKPLARGYAVKYTDEWCATTVSACAIKADMTDIIPTECSCQKQIELFKNLGSWRENENCVPEAGWIIYYDWQDNGVGDNTGWADHVGIVESCDGTTITVIEGNKGEAVARRTLKVNGQYIRGYGVPKYDKETTLASANATAEEKVIWDFLMGHIKNEYGVAGLMGNLYAESGLIPNNLQNTSNAKLNMTDAQYTDAVDKGAYTNFVKDSGGYGLAQWTYWSRKEALLNFAKSKKASIGNLEMQLEFMVNELKGYKAVYSTLTSAKSVLEASNAVLINYEAPASKDSADTQRKRANYGQTYYDKYASKKTVVTIPTSGKVTATQSVKATKGADKFSKTLAGDYKVTALALYVRHGGGTKYKKMTSLPKGTVVHNYGYYDLVDGVKWLYIAVTYKNTSYVGFCSSKYLQKV